MVFWQAGLVAISVASLLNALPLPNHGSGLSMKSAADVPNVIDVHPGSGLHGTQTSSDSLSSRSQILHSRAKEQCIFNKNLKAGDLKDNYAGVCKADKTSTLRVQYRSKDKGFETVTFAECEEKWKQRSGAYPIIQGSYASGSGASRQKTPCECDHKLEAQEVLNVLRKSAAEQVLCDETGGSAEAFSGKKLTDEIMEVLNKEPNLQPLSANANGIKARVLTEKSCDELCSKYPEYVRELVTYLESTQPKRLEVAQKIDAIVHGFPAPTDEAKKKVWVEVSSRSVKAAAVANCKKALEKLYPLVGTQASKAKTTCELSSGGSSRPSPGPGSTPPRPAKRPKPNPVGEKKA